MVKRFQVMVSSQKNRKSKRPQDDILEPLLDEVYKRAVTKPETLNNYIPFSSNVYGETTFQLVSQVVEAVDIKKDEIFLDLGSGIGMVVMQLAALGICKHCIGIEIAEVPSTYAKAADIIFKRVMARNGISHGTYELIRGDFLSLELRQYIESASVIFINNLAFDPETNLSLGKILYGLKDGIRIISAISFSGRSIQINERNCLDVSSILQVSKSEISGPVSWTNKPLRYFLQTIDRTALNKYYVRLNYKPNIKGTSEKSSCTGQKLHACEKCNVICRRLANLSKHMKVQHKIITVSKFRCSRCSKYFQRSAFLKQHLKKCGINKDHICISCGKNFGTRKGRMEDHNRKCGQGSRNIVPRQRIKSEEISNKQHIHHEYSCKECNLVWPRLACLQLHRKKQHEWQPPTKHVCLACDTTFTRSTYLVKHQIKCGKQKDHVCQTCGKNFGHRRGRLQEHIIHHHSIDESTNNLV